MIRLKKLYIYGAAIFIFLICRSNSFSYSSSTSIINTFTSNQKDSLNHGENDTSLTSGQADSFRTFKIITNIKDEDNILAEKLYNFQYELGIPKGLELEQLEIYVDKTSEDKSKWNVIVNDTTLQFNPTIGWSYLTDVSREMLENWTGKGEKTDLDFKKVYSVDTKPNEMFRVIATPLVPMGTDSKLSVLQKDYSYEIIIVDDYPEQVEIESKPGIIIKRLDKNRFRIKLSKFNRAEFEKWAENKADDPYVYTTTIMLYDKISNQKSKPIILKYTFGEY